MSKVLVQQRNKSSVSSIEIINIVLLSYRDKTTIQVSYWICCCWIFPDATFEWKA